MLFRDNFYNLHFIIFIHIAIITLSNLLVQYPFTLFGFHTTWGAFTYPLIFVITDLTARILGQNTARNVIFKAMLPGLFISYFLAVLFANTGLFTLNILAFRVALACFMAYVIGQLLDIMVFQRFRTNSRWWVAPLFSLVIGNIIDTFIFFFVAFFQCSDPILSMYWPEIALVDAGVKLIISVVCFLPTYGVMLNYITKYMSSHELQFVNDF